MQLYFVAQECVTDPLTGATGVADPNHISNRALDWEEAYVLCYFFKIARFVETGGVFNDVPCAPD